MIGLNTAHILKRAGLDILSIAVHVQCILKMYAVHYVLLKD